MGLDMNLSRKVYLELNYQHNRNGVCKLIVNDKEIDITNLQSLEFEEVYWRKVNHIHNWFVQNVQDGEDDCKEYYVSIEQLQELIDLCKKVINREGNPEELLPTQSGFFFGNTEYDEYYYNSLQYTIDNLEKVIENPNGSFYYSSSW